jgi:cysteine desulfurase
MTIDLDHNATSPLDPDVFEAMKPHWFAGANPESRHSSGRSARRAVIVATETVAKVLHAHPDEVIFTSGGTEANNLAIFGHVQEPAHIIASPIEHPAIAEPLRELERKGFKVDRPEVSIEGLVSVDLMMEAIRSDTKLATLILAHNETGAIQPVEDLARRCAERKVPVHTDAVQAVGRIPVDFHTLQVQTLAASAHKFGGPCGVGLLLVRQGCAITPRLFGGGQQRGIRPGTIPVALVVGLAAALEKWAREAESRIARWIMLRDRLEANLLEALGPARIVRNGPCESAKRLPQTLHVSFPGAEGDALLMKLDLAGVRASLGSACASGTTKPSESLMAMNLPEDRLRSSVRFSLGVATTEEQIDEAARRIVGAVG